MANSVSHAALPFPVKNARFTVIVPYLDADGDPTDPTTPDTEVSGDGGAFADCAEEVTTISGTNGSGYLTLTGAETNYSIVQLAAKVASGPKATLITVMPRVLPVIFSGTASAGASGSITLPSSCPSVPDILVGCIVRTTGGTGGGGTGGANNQARIITGYTSARVASVTPNWETAPDNTTTFEILYWEGAYAKYADIVFASLSVRGVCTTGGTTTSIPTSSLEPAATVTDQFKGRILIFDRDTTTTNLRGQGAPIDGSTSGGTLTLAGGDALTTAPASGDTFRIL
jgi:hypothetical protein